MPRYIDADALISKIAFHRDSLKPYNVVAVSAFDAVIGFIKTRPTVSPDEVRGVGEWERIDYPVGHDYKCLACGKLNDRASNYCPDCGKPMRMKGAEDEHD